MTLTARSGCCSPFGCNRDCCRGSVRTGIGDGRSSSISARQTNSSSAIEASHRPRSTRSSQPSEPPTRSADGLSADHAPLSAQRCLRPAHGQLLRPVQDGPTPDTRSARRASRAARWRAAPRMVARATILGAGTHRADRAPARLSVAETRRTSGRSGRRSGPRWRRRAWRTSRRCAPSSRRVRRGRASRTSTRWPRCRRRDRG